MSMQDLVFVYRRMGWDVAQLVRASDCDAADAG